MTDPSAVDSVVQHYVDNGIYPFVYVRLEHLDGTVMYEHSAVNRSIIPEMEINKDSWIRIWSMSKIVTISVLLDLVEEGLVNLDDPVTKFIPEFENLKVAQTEDGKNLSEIKWGEGATGCPHALVPTDSVMTVLHLINHESGFYYAVTGIPCLDSMAAALELPKAKKHSGIH